MQVKNAKLQQESEQLSSAKERLSLENQQIANELKVHICPLRYTPLTRRNTPAMFVQIYNNVNNRRREALGGTVYYQNDLCQMGAH